MSVRRLSFYNLLAVYDVYASYRFSHAHALYGVYHIILLLADGYAVDARCRREVEDGGVGISLPSVSSDDIHTVIIKVGEAAVTDSSSSQLLKVPVEAVSRS